MGVWGEGIPSACHLNGCVVPCLFVAEAGQVPSLCAMGNPISRELFLERARSRFGDRYDYGEIIYKSYKSPIKIRCKMHPVKQICITPEKHLQTTGGCKYCLREMRIQMLERELNRQSAQHPPVQAGEAARLEPQTAAGLGPQTPPPPASPPAP